MGGRGSIHDPVPARGLIVRPADPAANAPHPMARTPTQIASSQLLLAIWDRFHEHGIEIPYPQRDLHFRSSDIGLPGEGGPSET